MRAELGEGCVQACVWGELRGYLRMGPVHRCEPHAEPHARFCVWPAYGEMTLCQRRAGWNSHLADRAMMTASTGLCVPGTRAMQELRGKTGMRKSQRFLWVSFQGTRSDLCLCYLGSCCLALPFGRFHFSSRCFHFQTPLMKHRGRMVGQM